uniref:Uncharacterized protein n=1 Tax=Arundo donax TaxID=35708 RepID=A0A0A9BRM8_ARUDO
MPCIAPLVHARPLKILLSSSTVLPSNFFHNIIIVMRSSSF